MRGRPTTNPASIERRAMVEEIRIMSANTKDALVRVRKTVRIMEAHPEGFAAATGSNMLGNGLRATVRDAMIEAQNNQCFTCGVGVNNPKAYAATEAVLFRLVPSIVGADEDVAGTDAMSAGTLPGNVVVTCKTCSNARNAASAAIGSPVAVTSKSMHAGGTEGPVMLNASRILYVWPASPKRTTKDGSAMMHNRIAARVAALGW